MSRFADLGSRIAADLPTDDQPCPEDEEDESTTPPASKKKDKTMNETPKADIETARTEGHAAGFAEANARFNAVLGSEHYAGRETLAQTLLGNAKLGAEEIVAALATAPKVEANSLELDPEASERNALRQNLAESQPGSTTEAGGEPAPEANHGWGEIHAEIRAERAA